MTYDPTTEQPWGYTEGEPDQTTEELCGAQGHIYDGDDTPHIAGVPGGRCYCGQARYTTGGEVRRRFECVYTTKSIVHGLGTPNPVVTVFFDGCSQLFDWEPLSPDELSVRAGHLDAGGEWVDLPADRVVIEHG